MERSGFPQRPGPLQNRLNVDIHDIDNGPVIETASVFLFIKGLRTAPSRRSAPQMTE